MRIGIIVPEFPTYSETFFVSLVKGLCERGHHVIVFRSIRNRDLDLERIYGLDSLQNLETVNMDFSSSLAGIRDLLITHPLSLLKSAGRNRTTIKRKLLHNIFMSYFDMNVCDVYHFGYSGLAIFYAALLPFLKGKIMISCLGSAEKVKPLTDADRVAKLEEVLNAAHSIHCVSEDMATTIKLYGAPPAKIYVNRPAVDHFFFDRKSVYEPSSFIHILSIGRLFFQKGFSIGLLAIYALKKKFSDFCWTIVGDGPDLDELVFQIHALGLEKNVVLAGKKTKDEVFALYGSADIFFLPSVSEGIANVVLEAMSMQLPVVSSDCGGMGEAIVHNNNGLLCNNYDYPGMAELLYELCMCFEKRKTLGQNARETILERFTLQRYMDVYEMEYKKLLKDDVTAFQPMNAVNA